MRKGRNQITCYQIKFLISVCTFIVITKDSTARRRKEGHGVVELGLSWPKRSNITIFLKAIICIAQPYSE